MKRKSLFGGVALSLSFLMVAGAMAGVASKKAVEANAATTNASGTRVYIEDQTNDGWTYYSDDSNKRDAFMHVWGLSFDSSSSISSVSDMDSASISLGSSIEYDTVSNSFDVEMTWASGSHRQYEVNLPWYITEFTMCFFAKNSSGTVWLKNYDGSDKNFSVALGNEVKVYLCDNHAWGDGYKCDDSTPDYSATDYVYAQTTYTLSLTASPAAGGVVNGAGTYKEFQKVQVSAVANTGYSFSGWSDSGSSVHYVSMTSDKALTATFSTLPALSSPVLTKDANNNITWSAVANAVKYSVSINSGTPYDVLTTEELKVDAKIVPGSYTISVTAVGDHLSYNDSNAATSSYTVADGYYLVGQFQTEGWDITNLIDAIRFEDHSTYFSCSITVASTVQVKAIFKSGSSADRWQAIKDNTVNNNPFADDSYNASFVDNNVSLPKAGTYTIKIEPVDGNQDQSVYTVSVPDAAFVLTINGTESGSMAYHEGNKFKITGVNLSAGDVIGYKKAGTAVSDSTAEVIYNNNIDSDKKVLLNNASSDIYIDVVAKKIWVSGLYPTSGYHMVVNGDFVQLTHNENPQDPSYNEYYSVLINFAKDDVITFIDIKDSGEILPVSFKISTINSGGLGAKFKYDSDLGLVAKEAVTASVYLKIKSGADEVYFGEVDEDFRLASVYAKHFVETLKDGVDPVCKGIGSTKIPALQAAWNGLADDYADTSTYHLTDSAKNTLKTASVSGLADVNQFADLYDWIMSHYATELAEYGDNFAARTTPSPVRPYNPIIGDASTSNIVAIVTIISLISVTAIGAFFYIKKRKHI